MLTTEQKKHVDAFEYWVKTNTENGVSTIPKSICDNIIAILKDKDGDTSGSEVNYDRIMRDVERYSGTWTKAQKIAFLIQLFD